MDQATLDYIEELIKEITDLKDALSAELPSAQRLVMESQLYKVFAALGEIHYEINFGS